MIVVRLKKQIGRQQKKVITNVFWKRGENIS
jgi:hypothetical protein